MLRLDVVESKTVHPCMPDEKSHFPHLSVPPAQNRLEVQEQAPPEQLSSCEHGFPQAPQLALLVLTSTQAPLHHFWPAGQQWLASQLPLLH
jgi:hypothetical protein